MTLLGWGALCVLASCNSLLGIDELPRQGPVELAYANPECKACVAKHCAAQERACTEHDQCLKHATCTVMVPLDSPEARFACDTNYQSGSESPQGVALDACRRAQCKDDCYGLGGIFDFDQACNECLLGLTQCHQQIADCIGDAHCDRFLGCVGEELNPDQLYSCFYDVGLDSQLAWDAKECILKTCPEQCGTGTRWDCLDRYYWPPAQGESVQIRFGVVKAGSYDSVDGVDVGVCDFSSSACPDGGTTLDGSVELRLPTGNTSQGFTGHLELTGGNPPIIRELVFFGRRIYRDETRVQWPVLLQEGVPSALLDPAKGHLGAFVFDCTTYFASGVQVEIEPAARTEGLLGTFSFPQDGTTGGDGSVSFFNLMPGCFAVSARYQGQVIAKQYVRFEEGTLSTLALLPTSKSEPAALGCVPGT